MQGQEEQRQGCRQAQGDSGPQALAPRDQQGPDDRHPNQHGATVAKQRRTTQQHGPGPPPGKRTARRGEQTRHPGERACQQRQVRRERLGGQHRRRRSEQQKGRCCGALGQPGTQRPGTPGRHHQPRQHPQVHGPHWRIRHRHQPPGHARRIAQHVEGRLRGALPVDLDPVRTPGVGQRTLCQGQEIRVVDMHRLSQEGKHHAREHSEGQQGSAHAFHARSLQGATGARVTHALRDSRPPIIQLRTLTSRAPSMAEPRPATSKPGVSQAARPKATPLTTK